MYELIGKFKNTILKNQSTCVLAFLKVEDK